MPEDLDLPQLLEGEGPSLDAATILQAQGLGNWARTFGKGDTNPLQRRRPNADIARETAIMQEA
jgi:hypothetical protein